MRTTIVIDYVAGESLKDRTVRIHRLIAREKNDKGFKNQAFLSRSVSELAEALENTREDQRVELSDESRGSLARRAPIVKLAANTGVKELDEYIERTIPNKGELSEYSSPREKALAIALPSAVGVSKGLRVPNLDSDDRIMAANILGSLPSGGMSLEESARTKLSSTVKQALGDLGVGAGNVQTMLRDRLASRPFFNDPVIMDNFANMIRAYHDVRENNLHYAQALVPGLKGLKDSEMLPQALLPSPDSILNGTTAYLIYRIGEKPSITRFKGYMDQFISSLLNLQGERRGITASEKQQDVGALLKEFEFNRKKAASAILEAVKDAMAVGADFASAYSKFEFQKTEEDEEQEKALKKLKTAFEDAKKEHDENKFADRTILDMKGISESSPGVSRPIDEQKKFFDFMIEERIVFEISNKFILVPLVLPTFNVTPVGWDRRWMIATMKVFDEYWNMIYGDNREILIQDLLYLIAARTKELFDYDIDVVQMTILALLLTDSRTGARRARSIMPRNKSGKLPLRTLTKLIQESAKEERRVREKNRVPANLQMQAEMSKIKDAKDQKDYRQMANRRLESYDELEDIMDRIASEFAMKEAALYANLVDEFNLIDDPYESDAPKGKDAVWDNLKAQTDKIGELYEKFEDGNAFEKFKSYKDDLQDILGLTMLSYLSNKDKLADMGFDDLKEFITELGFSDIELTKDDGSGGKKNRDADEIAGDLYDQHRKSMRRARRTAKGKELGFITAEVSIGRNVVKDIGSGLRDFFGGRSKGLEKHVGDALDILVQKLQDECESLGGDYVDDIAIQPLVYGATMLNLFAHGVAYDTGGKRKTIAKSRKAKASILEYTNHPMCPIATTDLKVNTRNRDAAIKADYIQYGPLNLTDNGYWVRYADHWNTDVANAKESNCSNCVAFDISPRMLDCMPGPVSEKEGYLGYCWMHHFKCHSARTCYTWAKGGPIEEDSKSMHWQTGEKPNPPMPDVTDYHDFDSETVARQHARSKAMLEDDFVYMWTVGDKFRVSPQMPGNMLIQLVRYFAQDGSSGRVSDLYKSNPQVKEKLKPGSTIMRRSDGKKFTFVSTMSADVGDGDTAPIYHVKDSQSGEDLYLTNTSFKQDFVVDYDLSDGPSAYANPPKKDSQRKYKGMIIKKHDDGWEVEAYGKVFKTLKAAREFISNKVKGTASPNQRCVRIITGVQCTGKIVKMNKGGHYQCKKCKAKYKAV